MNAFDSPADDLDEWLTIQFAAIIITRFFKKIQYQSQQYSFYQKHKIKTRALNKYLSHLTTFKPSQYNPPDHNITYSHQQQSTPNKFSLASTTKSTSTDYYQSLLHQNPHIFTPSFQSTTKSITGQNNNLSDKFQFWRNIIELKRIHPNYSHPILMKCLIESQGDLHKAMILADDSDYILSQQQLSNSLQPIIQFNSSMKELFLPFYERYQHYHHRVELNDTDHPTTIRTSTRQESDDYDHINVNTKLSTIRSLKLRHSLDNLHHTTNNNDDYQQQQLYKRKKDLLFHFINVIEKTYLSSSTSSMINGKSSLKKVKLKSMK